MKVLIDIKKISLISRPFLIIAFILAVLSVSLGRVATWDLLEQIAMADNYVSNGLLHTEPESSFIHGHSVYFPGVAYLAIGFKRLGVDYFLVEVMLLMAVVITVLFLHLLSIYARSFSIANYTTDKFYPIIISYVTLGLPFYLRYALEFKPDTLALLLGYTGLNIIMSKNRNIWKLILASLVMSLGVVFKQQYMAFQLGLFFSALLINNRLFRLGVLITNVFSILIFFSLIQDSNIRFWTVEVLADDGLLTFRRILLDGVKLVIPLLMLTVLAILAINDKQKLSVKIPELSKVSLQKFKENPWFLVTCFVIVAAVLSAFKFGGNVGNTQLALAVLFPLVGLFVKRLSEWRIILIAWLSIIYFVEREIPYHVQKYGAAVDLKRQVENLKSDENQSVLTGSNVYYASRVLLSESVSIENYWSKSLIENTKPYPNLKLVLENYNYDYLIVENTQSHLDYIRELPDYRIIYVNSLGIIAESTKG